MNEIDLLYASGFCVWFKLLSASPRIWKENVGTMNLSSDGHIMMRTE